MSAYRFIFIFVEREKAAHAVVSRCRVRPDLLQRLLGLAPAPPVAPGASG